MNFLKKVFSTYNSNPKQDRLNKKYKLRNEFWEKVGAVDKDVLSFLINPAFQNQPAWPDLRQAFKRITTDNSIILATDGLSDEFSNSDKPDNGLGIELFVEVDDLEYMKMPLSEIKNTWVFKLLNQAAINAVKSRMYLQMAHKYNVFSTEFYDVNVPKSFINKEERVGVLIGMKSDKVPSILKIDESEILMLSVTLLKLENLKHINEQSEKGREAVVRQLIASGKKNISSIR